MTATRYPDITVQLTGTDGNACAIIGAVLRALYRAQVPTAEIDKFRDEATSGDYENVIQTAMRWVDVD